MVLLQWWLTRSREEEPAVVVWWSCDGGEKTMVDVGCVLAVARALQRYGGVRCIYVWTEKVTAAAA